MTQGYAIFRLPYEQECHCISGSVSTLPSCASLSGRSGFVVAPFAPSDLQPVLLIEAEGHEPPTSLPELPVVTLEADEAASRADYHVDFANFHACLLSGQFQKLVLSRSIDVGRVAETTPTELFTRACHDYPRMFVALIYTPQSGLWLTATPEILLSGSDHQWQTMALAGTMPYSDRTAWSDKNIQEQRYVATYIARRLEQFTDDFREEGPYTQRAGHLAHLRSDFHFQLSDEGNIGQLLTALHPTPAVCGLPKDDAFRFICRYEHHDRTYYSGFMGPLFVGGQTSLFVTLRCMQVYRNGYRLYAGGGLLKDSVEEQEWQETETKLDTMRHIIGGFY